jgi:hypothetical protein
MFGICPVACRSLLALPFGCALHRRDQADYTEMNKSELRHRQDALWPVVLFGIF